MAEHRVDRPDDGPSHRSEEADAAKSKGADRPAAGPHAKPELTNPDATPGAGTLPDPDEKDGDGVSS